VQTRIARSPSRPPRHRPSARAAVVALTAFATALGALAPLGDAAAAPTDPVTVTPAPEDQGPAFVPGVRLVADLPRDYVEEEYFVSGHSTLFNYANDPPEGPTDIVPIDEDVPYTTRIIVRRPAHRWQFNGTVVIEWWNSTAGFDTAPVWDPSAEYFAREGFVYVGVTNSTTALDFLVDGCRTFGILPPTCGTRYTDLSLPENGLAYEMVSQIAHLLKSGGPESPLPRHFRVKRLYHAGQSQQGGSMVTYASAFHFADNDGYFVQQAATARRINFGPACGDAGAPPFPDCTPTLEGDDRLVRTDLPVPVYHAITETDVAVLFGTVGRQPDTPTFRYWEIAGGGHLTVHEGVELVPAGVLGPDPIILEDLCEKPLNTTADGPVFVSYVFDALWENLERQVRWGRTPPAGVLLDVDPSTGEIERDELGNALGGVRLPVMEAPTATYTPGNAADPTLPPLLQSIGNLACFLASSVEPFDQATLDQLYPTHGRYVSEVARATAALRRQGLLLPRDAFRIVRDAAKSDVGCGLGFELVLILPGLMALRGRRTARTGRDAAAPSRHAQASG